MQMKSKMALVVLALVVGCFPAFAQGDPAQGQPSAQQGPSDGPGGRGSMRPREPMGRGGSWGQMGRWGRMGMGGRGMGRHGFAEAGILNNPAIRQRLGITAEQTAKIREQNLDFEKSKIRSRADLQVKRIELNDLLAADNPDRAAIDAKLQEVSAAQMALEKATIDNRLALRAILTPAQRQQLQQLRMNGFQPTGGGEQGGPRRSRGTRPPGQPGTVPPNQQGQKPPNQ